MLSTSNYVYVMKGETPGAFIYEVGYWRTYANGEIKFKVESRWTDDEAAAHRVSFLNGGNPMPSWMMEFKIDPWENYIDPEEAARNAAKQ